MPFHKLIKLRLVALLIATTAGPNVATAQSIPNMTCTSPSPIWTLELLGDTATFAFADKTIQLDVMDQTQAEPGPWPVALTLLARHDTAIVVLRKTQTDRYSVDILTQRRNLPVLFTGQCKTR